MIPEVLLKQNETNKRSYFAQISQENPDKNRIIVKNVLKDLEHSDEQREFIAKTLENPHGVSSLAFFTEEDTLLHLQDFPFAYDADYKYKRHFILPFFDYRIDFLSNLHVLVFSKNSVGLFRVTHENLQEIALEHGTSLAEHLKEFEQKKSIQHHTADKAVFHGHGSKDSGQEGDAHLNTLLPALVEEVSVIVKNKKNGTLLLAATDENIGILSERFKTHGVTLSGLHGNYDQSPEVKIMEKLKEIISDKSRDEVERLQKEIDVSESNSLQSKNFLEILSEVEQGKIDHFYVGNVGLGDLSEENPIAPLGANYIAHEVIKYGGKVSYYPGVDFSFSKNNILFK
ncbi:hypothetical protein KC717_01750, partial [Candidatus Dojkabacteria bacterium]|nr:hypothetical protein [Candidatus Dojkabacteria bacterium]